MPWSVADIPAQTGRVAVVTGANGGLGLATAEVLAGKGAHVVMAVRDREKSARAGAQIRAAHPDASLEEVDLDLADQSVVKAAAATIVGRHPVVDLLVNNAGLMALPQRSTVDGYEMQFGVNHLGHWTLTAALLPAILRGAQAGRTPRVVTVSSTARFIGAVVDPDDPHMRRRYNAWRAYGQSKLANYLFGIGLQRQFDAAGVDARSLVAHPGLTHTDLQATTAREAGGGWIGGVGDRFTGVFGMSAAAGARMQLRAATDPAAKGGELYAPRFASTGPPVRRPVLRPGLDAAIATVWAVSERETGVRVDVTDVLAALDA